LSLRRRSFARKEYPKKNIQKITNAVKKNFAHMSASGSEDYAPSRS
jgi:hypothetical protein